MKKVIISICIVALVVLFGGRAWYLYQHQEKGDNILRIGCIRVSPSSMMAQMGKEVFNGMTLAQEEINNSDDYAGRKIQFVTEYSDMDAKSGVSAFQKILLHDISAAFVMGDLHVPAIAPIIKERQIPTVTSISYNDEFLKYNHPKYLYKNFVSVNKLFRIMAKRVRNRYDIKKVAIYAVNAPFGKQAIKGIEEGLKNSDIQIVHPQLFAFDDMDCRAPIEKLMSEKPDAVFFAGYGVGYSVGINRLRELGFKGKIFTTTSFKDVGFKEHVKTDENIVFIQQYDEDLNEKKSAFAQAYKKRFNEDPGDFSVFGYSSVMLIAEAMKNAKTLDKKDIHDALNQIKTFKMPIGILQLNEDGSSDMTLILAETLGNGRYKVLEIIEPDGTMKKVP